MGLVSEPAFGAVVTPPLDPILAVRRMVEFARVVSAFVFVPFVALGWPASW